MKMVSKKHKGNIKKESIRNVKLDSIFKHRQLKITPVKPENVTTRDKTTRAPVITGLSTIDLKLPESLRPMEMTKFQNSFSPLPSKEHANNLVTDMINVIGSTKTDDNIYFKNDTGLFQCVHEAWMNHWNLRTTPEDWWYPVACRIAKAVSDAAKIGDNEAASKKVRDLFVSHEGKETIKVKVPATNIYEVVYEDVFSQFSNELHKRIKVPEYAIEMQNNFSTSGLQHKISSQINLMASLKEFFKYKIFFIGCGLKGIEMHGEQSDWDSLSKKLETLRKILEPIKDELKWRLHDSWWDNVSNVFQHLALTRKSPTSLSVRQFWSEIITKTKDWERAPGAYGMGPRTHQVDAYDGWLIKFLTGERVIKMKDLKGSGDEQKVFSGLNQTPVEIEMTWKTPTIPDTAQLCAGIMGFTLHEGEQTFNGVPSLQPFHMWAIMLPPSSPLLKNK